MSNDLAWLLGVSAILLISALASGLLPLAFVKVRWMHKVTAVGAGLCIGAALGLMTPESFSLVFEAHEKYDMNPGTGGFFLTFGVLLFMVLEGSLSPDTSHHICAMQHDHNSPPTSESGINGVVVERDRDRKNSRDGGTDVTVASAYRSSVSARMDTSLLPTSALARENESNRLLGSKGQMSCPNSKLSNLSREWKGWSTLLFMVIHAISDGLVVGSVAATGQQKISIVVAAAMIAHKIPASFALSSYFVSLNWPLGKIVRSVGIFSASSPLAAIVFFSMKYLISETTFEKGISLVMIFSAGSVLYVGFFHMFPEAVKAYEAQGKRKADAIMMVALGGMVAACAALIPHSD
mmetsp:Transcript_14994/g.29010  ORF Transcript_14994/g.29010 Transcript_14994/m.29010 type:complete len:351 (+) Transcript_14994:98-1150(+)